MGTEKYTFRRYGKLLAMAAFFLCIAVVKTRAQNTDIDPATANIQTIPAGTYVIAMDSAQQSNAGLFNVTSYGLLVTLLNNEIALEWVIRTGKVKDDTDFTGMATRVFPTAQSASLRKFMAGPFLIYPEDSAGVSAIINAFNNAQSSSNRVNVYQLTTAVHADVRYTLTETPYVGIMNDGNNESIHEGYMTAASVPSANYTVGNGAGLTTTCYTFASEPHNDNPVAATVDSIKAYIKIGGNFLAECAAIPSYENFANGIFQTSLGIIKENTNVTTTSYPHPDLSFTQYQGTFDAVAVGGSCQNWKLNTGSTFINNGAAYDKGSPGVDTLLYEQSVSKNGTGTGHLVFYTGGHTYTPANNSNLINGLRSYFNAMLTPSGVNLCAYLSFNSDLSLTKTASLNKVYLGEQDTFNIVLTNNGPRLAVTTNISVTDVLPAGFSYISSSATRGSYSLGTGIWSIDSVKDGNSYTLSIIGTANTLGSITNTAYLSKYKWDHNQANDTSSTTITVVNCVVAHAGNDTAACHGNPVVLGASPAATSGTAPFSYSWTPSAGLNSTTLANPTATPSSTTSYILTITDSLHCPAKDTVVVTVYQLPSVTASTSNSNYCSGNTIQLNSNPTGGTPGYTYNWSGPDAFSDTTGSPARPNAVTAMSGTYTVTVTDAHSCTATASAFPNVTINLLPSITATSNKTNYCAGDTVKLSSNPSSGTPGYTYSWSGPSGFSAGNVQNPMQTGISAGANGTYNVTVTDTKGCSASASTSYTTVTPRPALTASGGSSYCSGNTILLSSSPSGGTGSYTFAWSGPPANSYSSTLQNPARSGATSAMAGVYSVIVSDSLGCKDTASTSGITINPSPTITASSNKSFYCVGDTIKLSSSPSGGTLPYASFSWTGSGSTFSPNNVQNPNILNATTGLNGTYTVTVTDNNGCTASASTSSITIYSSLIVSNSSNSPVCSGGTIDLSSSSSNGTGPFSYSWSGPGFSSLQQNPTIGSATSLNQGNYTTTITDNSGCKGTATTQVTVNPTASVTVNSNSPVCSGNNISLSTMLTGGTAPFTYNWSGPLSFSDTAASPVINSAITGNQGNYTVTITDNNGCSGTGTSFVTVNSTPVVTAASNSIVCFGDTLNLNSTPTGGNAPYNFSWSGPGSFSSAIQNPEIANAAPAMNGTYSVTLTDVNSCSATASTAVTVNPSLTATASAPQTICKGDSVSLGGNPQTASGGTNPYAYSWTNGAAAVANPLVGPASTTTYTILVTDNNSCTATASAIVNVNVNPVANAGSTQNLPACSPTGIIIGGSPTGSGSAAPYSYLWSPATALSSDTAAKPRVVGLGTSTTYQVTVTDNNGCSSTAQAIVNVTNSPPIVNISAGGNTAWCANSGSSVALSTLMTGGVSPFSYSWSGVDISPLDSTTATVNPDTTGSYNYIVAVTDKFNCSTSASLTVTVNPLPSANAGSGFVTCYGIPVIVGGSPTGNGGTAPYSYNWNGGLATVANPSANPAGTTVYSVTVTDNESCTATASTTLTVNVNPTANAGTPQTIPSCSLTGTNIGGAPTAGSGTAPYQYNWSPAAGLSSSATPNPHVSGLGSTTIYTVLVTDTNGCSATASVQVTVNSPSLGVDITENGPLNWCSGTNGNVILTANPLAGYFPYTYAWSGTDISSSNTISTTVSPDSAGIYTYSVIITDSTGCYAGASTTVIVNQSPTANAGTGFVSCSGSTVTIGGSPTANSGTPPYTYNWDGGAAAITNPSVNPTSNTTYTVSVTDSLGCSATANTNVTVHANPSASAGLDKILSSCSPSGITIGGSPTASGGLAPYSYSWTPAVALSSANTSNPIVAGLSADTLYTVIVTDSNGCTASASMRVTVSNNTPSASITSSNTPQWCAGSGDNTNFTASISGGTAPFSYNWSGANINPINAVIATANPNAAGNYVYQVNITDAFNCTTTAGISITVNSNPSASAGAASYVICDGNIVNLGGSPTASGGTSPYAYSWNNGVASIANPTVAPSSTTTYQVAVTDSNGCSATASTTITVHSNPVANAGTSTTVPSCSPTGVQIGGSPTASGGASGYTYNWSPASGLNNITVSNPVVTGITADTTYTVTVTDANNCSATAEVLVNANNNALIADITSGNATEWCSGSGSSANLTANISGGSNPFTYSWTGTDVNPINAQVVTASPTAAGSYTYTVTITDGYNCTATATETVTVDSLPSANAGSPQTICSGNSVTLGGSPSASGGHAPYAYSWSAGAASIANPSVSPSYTTTYLLIVTDNKNCSATSSAMVTVNQVPVADAGINASLPACSPTGITIGGNPTANGGGGAPYTYLWSPSTGLSSDTVANPTVSGLISDVTYAVLVTDKNGCTGSAQVTIHAVTANPVSGIVSSGSTNWCAGTGSSTNLTASIAGATPPYTYNWTGTDVSATNAEIVTVNPNSAGNYTYNVTVTDAFNCSATASETISVNPVPVANAGASGFTICFGTSVTIGGLPTASGGIAPYAYSWSSGLAPPIANPIVNPTGSIAYSLTVTDSTGCSATASTIVTVLPQLNSNAGSNQQVVNCSGSCVSLGGAPTASGGMGSYTYQWSPAANLNDATLAHPLACGLLSNTFYTLVVTDSTGCTASSQVLVSVSPNSLSAEAGAGGFLCSGPNDSMMLGGYPTAQGGTPPYSYAWSPVAGLNLNNPANPYAQPVNTTPYSLTVSDALGCSATGSTTVDISSPLNINAGNDTSICRGFPVVLGSGPTASGGSGNNYTYLWSPTTDISSITSANPEANPSGNTSYIVTVTDGNGCSASSFVQINVRPTPVINVGPNPTLTACPGDSVILGMNPVASGAVAPYTYSWSPSLGLNDSTAAQAVVKGLSVSQGYTLIVTDSTGCQGIGYVNVNVVPSTLQAEAGNGGTYCQGSGNVTLGGSPTTIGGYSPFSYSWSPAVALTSDTSPNPIASPDTTTMYSLIITDSKECTATASVNVTVNPLPVANAGTDTSVCQGFPVVMGGSPTASAGSGSNYTYNWSPSTNISSVSVPNPVEFPTDTTTIYEVTVTDGNGCTAGASMKVTVRPNPIVDAGPNQTLTACPDDSVTLGVIPVASGASAPYSYSWSPALGLNDSLIAQPVVKGLNTSQNYTLLVTDTTGCQGTSYVTVNVVPSTLQADAGNSGAYCKGSDSITLGGSPSAIGGFAPFVYSWTPATGLSSATTPKPVASPDTTTQYTLTISDAKGCVATSSVTVTVNPLPVVNAGADSSVCKGIYVTVGGSPTASGGSGSNYTYNWSPTIDISSVTAANPVIFAADTTTIYEVTVTDGNGCTAASSMKVIVRPNPVVDAGPTQTLTACPDDSVTLGVIPVASGASAPYSYSWSPALGLNDSLLPQPVVKGLNASQNYTLLVTDTTGCQGTGYVTVNVVPSTLQADAGNNGAYCKGSDSITLGGSPSAIGGTAPFVYSWSPATGLSSATTPKPVASPDTTTQYTLTISDAKGCVATSSVTVTVNPLPVVNAGTDTSVCKGFTVIMGGSPTASGGSGSNYTYNWSPAVDISSVTVANPVVFPTDTTTIYEVTVTDGNSCTAASSMTVVVRPNPIVDAGPNQTLTACPDDSVTLGVIPVASGASSPYSYSWSPALGLNDSLIAQPVVKGLNTSQNYTLLVTDATGCQGTGYVTVNVVPSTLQANAGNNAAYCKGSDSITLGGSPSTIGGSAPFVYSWTPATGLSSATTPNPVASPDTTTQYTLTISDAKGCVATSSVTVTVNPLPVANAGTDTSVCRDFFVNIGGSPTASGGSGSNYTYHWSPPTDISSVTIANPAVFTADTTTIYTVIVTDGNACTASSSIKIGVRPNPVVNAGPTQTLTDCPDDSVTLGVNPVASGASAPYSYSWSPALGLNDSLLAQPVVKGLNASQNYTLLVTDTTGCQGTGYVTVNVVPSTLQADAGNNGAYCKGSGSITLGGSPSAIGGTAPFVYSWSPATGLSSASTPKPVASPDTTTQYTLTISDAKGCVATNSVTVTVNPLPVANAGTDTSVCRDFFVNIGGSPTATGGSGSNYTYHWSPPTDISSVTIANPAVFTADTTTIYTVIVTDGNACTASSSIKIGVRPNPVVNAGPTQTLTACPDDSITLGVIPVASGASAPYTYSWSPSIGLNDSTISDPVVKGLNAPQNYTLLVTDATGCQGTGYVTVNVVPSTLQADAGNNAAYCKGSDSITLGGSPSAIGGSAPFVYSWTPATGLSSPSVPKPVASPDTATQYTLTISDAKGCVAASSVTITVNPLPVVNAGADTSVCKGTYTSIGGSPTAIGGSGSNYTYNWSPTIDISSVTVANPVIFAADTTTIYEVTVTDGNGCTAASLVKVIIRPNPLVDAGPNQTLTACPDDSITLGVIPVASGASAPYTYSWSPALGLNDSLLPQPVVKGLNASQNYTLLVTDATGCQNTGYVSVNVVPSTLQADAGNNAAYCKGSDSIALGGSPSAIGGSAPFVYSWTPATGLSSATTPNPVASPDTTTQYTLTVSDAKGCVSTSSVTVTINPLPVATAGTDTSVCQGFSVVLGASPAATGGTPAYHYSWTPAISISANNIANPVATPQTGIIYTLSVTDANGCTAGSSVQINVNSNPSANAGPTASLISCLYDSVQLGSTPSANGGTPGYTYNWSPATGLNSNITPNPYVNGIVSTTLYSLTVTDTNGCIGVAEVLVNVVPSTLAADAGNGGSYCTGSGDIVTMGGSPTASAGSPGYVYNWSPAIGLNQSTIANPAASPAVSTIYYLTVTDSKGCYAVDSAQISVLPLPVANAGSDTTVCAGTPLTLGGNPTGSGGSNSNYNYNWAPGAGLSSAIASNPNVQPTITNTYTVTVTDGNNCSASAAVIVTVHANPLANAGSPVSMVSCSLDSMQLGGSPTASGGSGGNYQYLWSPAGGLNCSNCPNPYVSHLAANATYTLVVTDSFYCSAQSQVTVTVTNGSMTANAGNNAVYCYSSSQIITLGGSPTISGGYGPYSYLWSPSTGLLGSASSANPTASPLVSTTYSVVVTDSKGCIAEDTVRITVNPSPVVNAGSSDTVCAGTLIQLGGSPTASAGAGNYTYQWAPSAGLSSSIASNPNVQPTITNTYIVTVTDGNNCSASAAVLVTINQNPVANAGGGGSVSNCAQSCITIGNTPTASNGTAPYRYAWSPQTGLNNSGLSNPSVCNLSVQEMYTVTVTDAKGCTASSEVSVNSVPSTLTANAGLNKNLCSSQPSGITIGGSPSVAGGSLPYTIVWTPTNGMLTANNIAHPVVDPADTTEYFLFVKDAAGCTALDSTAVFVDQPVTASVHADTSICSGAGINIGGNPYTGSGGIPPYTYDWSPGTGLNSVTVASPAATPLTTSTYCVTVTDSVGCSASTCVSINVNPDVTACAGPVAGLTMTNCPGSSVQLGCTNTGSGGSGNYRYRWSPDSVGGLPVLNSAHIPQPIVSGLDTTTIFTVTVTDHITGCDATSQVTVKVNATNLTANAGPNVKFCGGSDSCIAIGGNTTAVGGQAPYSYSWSPVPGMDNPYSSNPCVIPQTTSAYTVTVTDQLGCMATASANIFVSPVITVNPGDDTTICYGESVTLGGQPIATGGTGSYHFNWSPSQYLTSISIANPTAQNVIANISYTLSVTDSLNCSSSAIIHIAARTLPTANAGPNETISACTADSVIIGGSPTASGTTGPYTYSWSPPFNLSLSCTNCSNPIVRDLGHLTQFCVIVTDSFGCQSSPGCTEITAVPNTLFVRADNGPIATCANDSNHCVNLGGEPSVIGGVPPYAYQWFGGTVDNDTVSNPHACPLASTEYVLIVTDSHGCQASDTTVVTVYQPPVPVIQGLNSTYCVNAGNVLMTGVPAGGTFSGNGVSGNIFQASLLGAGTWCVQYAYTDPHTGCSADTTMCVNIYNLPHLVVSGYATSYCQLDAPDTLIANPAGGIFSGNGISGNVFTPETAQIGDNAITYTYFDTLTGCSNDTQIIINIKESPSLSLTASEDTACANLALVFNNNALNVSNIIWSKLGGGNVGSGLDPVTVYPTGANYCVVATGIYNPGGCMNHDTLCVPIMLPPLAVADTAHTCEEQPVTIDVLNNVSDPQGHADNVSIIDAPHHGSLVPVNTGTYIYKPTSYYWGIDSFKYATCNTTCTATCDTGEQYISICYIHYPPVITDTAITIYENDSTNVCPNIYDVNNVPLTIGNAACTPLNGTLTFTSDSCFEYTPATNWSGTQVLCITVCDTAGFCDTGSITIHVLPVNRPPVAFPEKVYTCDSTPIGINVAAATSDPEGNPLSYSYGAVSGPGTGNWYATGNGAIVFVAETAGAYTFGYTVCNHSILPSPSLCASSIIEVDVNNCHTTSNDSIAANNDGIVTNTNTITYINELANDYYPNPGSLTVSILQGPDLKDATDTINPDGTVTYQSPTAGIDTIQYMICDPAPLCASAMIVIFVDTIPQNIVYPPVAVDDFDSTNYVTPVTIPVLSNDRSPDGDSIVLVTIPCQPDKGTASINANGTITYTPDSSANAYHPDTFCYKICDYNYPNLCDTAKVVVYIRPSMFAVNDTPTTTQNVPINITVKQNDWTPDGDTFNVYQVITTGTVGTVSINSNGTIHYTPNPDSCGYIDTFRYVDMSLLGAIDTATVYITVNCCSLPVAHSGNYIVKQGDSITISPFIYDSANAALATGEIVTAPHHGTANFINDSILIYTPNPNFCGFDTIRYRGISSCGNDTGVLSIDVTCYPRPYAKNDTVYICRKNAIIIPLLQGDTAPAGLALSLTNLGNPLPASLGNITNISNGVITYTAGNDSGIVRLNYTICDNGFPQQCDTGNVVIVIEECQHPVADTIYDTTLMNTPDTVCMAKYVTQVSGNWQIASLCSSAGGATQLNGKQCFIYTPNTGYYGNDTFCVVVCDSIGCDTSEAIITVLDTLVKAIPISCDIDTTVMNVPVTINVLANDIIPMASDTLVTVKSLPASGTVVVNHDNTITFSPDSNYQGQEEFSYQVCATTGTYKFCDTASVCVTVVDTTHHCFIPNGFSPNGDGVNDFYVIPCNDAYPNSSLEIYDRWGMEVWASNGHYLNDWSGSNQQGTKLPDGTYYIIYHYNDGTTKSEAKFVVISRD